MEGCEGEARGCSYYVATRQMVWRRLKKEQSHLRAHAGWSDDACLSGNNQLLTLIKKDRQTDRPDRTMTCTNPLFTHSPAELTTLMSHRSSCELPAWVTLSACGWLNVTVSFVMICESWVVECWLLPASHDPRGDSWSLSSSYCHSSSPDSRQIPHPIFCHPSSLFRESLQSDLYLFHFQFHSVILFHLVKPWLRFLFGKSGLLTCRA